MKIMSKSVSSKQRKDSNFSQVTHSNQGRGICCQQSSYEVLKTTRYTKRYTDHNTGRESIRDSSFYRSDLDSRLLVKDYKVELKLKILTIGQIISEMRKQEIKKLSKGKSSSKRQKIEVSLSKGNKTCQGERKTLNAIPKLVEIQRDHPFLRNFSNKSKIVNAVEQRMEQLLQTDHKFYI